MKLSRFNLAAALKFSLLLLFLINFPVTKVSAQDTKIALQRGYRTGYSDGYMSGYRDSIENAKRGYDRHAEYNKADRAYSKDYGMMEDYRDGYRQGFEIGYDTGFDKKSFDAVLPTELKRRGTIPSKTNANTTAQTGNVNIGNNTVNQQSVAARTENASYIQNNDSIIVIPADTELVIELLGDINTKDSKEGERFQARVVTPNEISGALIEGRIGKIEKPGRLKRRASMTLNFDQIRLSETRWANYNAILTEVLPAKGDNIRKVDTEGTVQGKSSVKRDIVTVGAATGTGLVVGAVVGGPVGAGVGAGVGAAFGVGAVVVDRGKHINIIKGQQLRIRTSYETQIR